MSFVHLPDGPPVANFPRASTAQVTAADLPGAGVIRHELGVWHNLRGAARDNNETKLAETVVGQLAMLAQGESAATANSYPLGTTTYSDRTMLSSWQAESLHIMGVAKLLCEDSVRRTPLGFFKDEQFADGQDPEALRQGMPLVEVGHLGSGSVMATIVLQAGRAGLEALGLAQPCAQPGVTWFEGDDTYVQVSNPAGINRKLRSTVLTTFGIPLRSEAWFTIKGFIKHNVWKGQGVVA